MWNFIVVGAGSAGAIVANRLSEQPSNKVLLIEAGGPSDGARFRIPAMSGFGVIGNPVCDWMFMTEADPTRNGRVDMWSRGKGLGGSSILNGTIYVRGNRGDYDHWAELGNSGWDYESVLSRFRRLEHGDADLSQSYGRTGPMHISQTRGVPRLNRVFLSAMEELGIPINADYNGEHQLGAAIAHVTQRRGSRWTTARGYLDPCRSRGNLSIRTGVTARRVLFDANRRAIGVELEQDGRIVIERCDSEVLLCASVFNTPKLLMLSGIGDPGQLAEHGIAVVHPSSGVGRNLHDHPGVPVKAAVNARTSNMDTGPIMKSIHALRYALFRSGPAAFIFPSLAFVKLGEQETYPDVEVQFAPLGYEMTDAGLKLMDSPTITLMLNVNRPRSRGQIRLRSPRPEDPPIIQPNMLGDERDLALLRECVKFGRRLLQTKAFGRIILAEHAPGPGVNNDRAIDEYVRNTATSYYHTCGTARMGVDAEAVVDPRLRVRGVEGLRLIDCSVIPQVPSANTNAVSMMIGEKGAEMVLEDSRRT